MAKKETGGLPVVPEGQAAPSLGFYVRARNGRKRNYIFSYKKAKRCPHNRLTALAIGGSWYRCFDCNYAFNIVASNMQPLHNLLLGSFFNAMHFAKEFGIASTFEVLRRPIGQYDGMAHKPLLPEGKTLLDAFMLLEKVDVTAEDGGKSQLEALLEEEWVGPEERAAFLADAERQERQQLKEASQREERKRLKPGRGHGRGSDADATGDGDKSPVPSLSEP